MEDERASTRWRRPRRRGTLAAAIVLHAALLAVLLHWQGRIELPRGTVVETTIWTPAPPRVTREPRIAALAPAVIAPRPKRHREVVPMNALPAPTIAPATPTPLASEPPASAASAPLRLTLSRQELHALEAATGKTLAQLVPTAPKPSALSQIGGEGDGLTEKQLPGGITEVHLHGSCYRLVPTARSQLDPFNAGPRLTGPCIPNF